MKKYTAYNKLINFTKMIHTKHFIFNSRDQTDSVFILSP